MLCPTSSTTSTSMITLQLQGYLNFIERTPIELEYFQNWPTNLQTHQKNPARVSARWKQLWKYHDNFFFHNMVQKCLKRFKDIFQESHNKWGRIGKTKSRRIVRSAEESTTKKIIFSNLTRHIKNKNIVWLLTFDAQNKKNLCFLKIIFTHLFLPTALQGLRGSSWGFKDEFKIFKGGKKKSTQGTTNNPEYYLTGIFENIEINNLRESQQS